MKSDFFSIEYSDYNDKITGLNKYKVQPSDFGVDDKDAVEVYKKMNADYRELEFKEKYQKASMSVYIWYFFGAFIICASIGGYINNSYVVASILMAIGIVLCIVGYFSVRAYKKNVASKKNEYKQMKCYNEKMEKFIKLNDIYNEKVDMVKIPIIKKIAESIKKHQYMELKEIILECYKRLGFKVYTTGIRKFGGVILRACNDKDYNIALIIFPYENPISGYSIQNLRESITKINHKIDYVYILTKFGEYSYDNWMGLYLQMPYKVIDAYGIAELIWDSNTKYFENEIVNKRQELKECNKNVEAYNKTIVNEWINVESSNVDKVYYNEEKQVLYIKFISNMFYAYYDVDKCTFFRLLLSNSKGRFVRYELKSYKYKNILEKDIK